MFQSAEDILTSLLDPGERLLWSGQPRGGIRLRPRDMFLIPFSLVWGGFAFFWEYMVLHATSKARGPVGLVLPLFGVPFVIVGLYVIFGRFFVDARSRARTFYGVTNARIIIVSGLFAQQTKSLQLRALADVSLTQRSDGSGTVSFGPAIFAGGVFPGGSWPGAGRYAPPAFDMIDNVKEAYDVIRGALKAAP
jgi:Bacterial PH domain